ncbi:MAG: M23 family metallopeptidase [Lachnospiraceae bacterium]|nr:M23 family metallopeptidase [Lachnospiraceae bacterium]
MEISKKYRVAVCAAILLFFSVAVLSGFVLSAVRVRNEPALSENLEKFRAFDIAAEHFVKPGKWTEERYRKIAVSFLFYNGKIREKDALCRKFSWYYMLMPKPIMKEYVQALKAMLEDVRVFPVGEDVDSGGTIQFEDSWGGVRSYGGDRRHEGTDLIPSRKERGYFAIVSVSDGIVEKKGWLNLGGYRLGIRSEHGGYYYYAHLDHYANGIEEGKKIQAGELIGYMGDSGYGEEGTVGKFEVHLHFGIYLDLNGKEISVNPYPILKYLEGYKVGFTQE